MARKARPLTRAALTLVAVGLVGCAAILGIDDRKLDTVSGDASQETAIEASNDGSMEKSVDGGALKDSADGDAAASDGPATGDSAVPDGVGVDAPMSDSATVDAPVEGSTCPNPCVLATGLNHPFLMASDSNNVYWTEFGDGPGSGNGSVKACPVAGCGAGPTVYAQGLGNPRGIAVDSTNVYFGIVGGVYACAIGGCGGSPMLLATANEPYGVAVDSTYVYWVDSGDSTVHRVAKTGGPDNVLYDAGDGLVYEPFQCVVDGPFLYFTDYDENAFRLSVTGGAVALLGNGNNNSVYGNAFGITTDPTSVYFGGNGIILRADKMIADSGLSISSRVPLAVGLAYNQSSGMIYWANWGSGNGSDGTIGKMTSDGGSAQVLVASLAPPEAVTVGDTYVVWISNGVWGDAGSTLPGTGALLRSAK